MPQSGTVWVWRAVAAQSLVTAVALPPYAVKRSLKIQRVGTGELDPFASAGVLKPEPDRMQPLALQAQPLGQHRVGAVGQVADTGMTQRGEVHPDLVGTPGLQVDGHQRS